MGQLQQATELIRRHAPRVPSVALILGSGLGGLADRIESPVAINFSEIPGFASASASGHRGQLILGQLESQHVVAMAGRLHRYEGFTHAQVVFPVHVMAMLGATRLIVSNAAGGLNPKLAVGDIVVIADHINWMPRSFELPRVASQTAAPPNGFPRRRGELYDQSMSRCALAAARQHDFHAVAGTYLATLGPTYETRSEYRMMRRLGADVAGMSTVPEVLAAAEHDMRILGLSMVSNVASPDQPVKASHQEVLQAGRAAETKMEAIVRAVLRDET